MRLLVRINHFKHVLFVSKIKFVRGEIASMSTIAEETNFTKIKEGKAEILFPDVNSVFYNPVQEFNRDITVAVIKEFLKDLREKKNDAISGGKNSNTDTKVKLQVAENANTTKDETGITILEALSATGLRSIRFAKEIPEIKKIVANDFSKEAFKSIKRNIQHNNVGEIVEPNLSDAVLYMYQNRGKEREFDVVDIDPYGSASIFLDAAVQSVKHEGLLCVTCTDMAVLAGNFPEAAWAKYQSLPLKTKACHEQALRVLLSSISAQAARYSRYIEPLLSISIDFYVRVFVRVRYGASKVKSNASKQMYVYRCGGCTSFHVQPVADTRQAGTNVVYHAATGPPVNQKCEHCNHNHKMGGPFWGAPLHDSEFVKRLLLSVTKSSDEYGSYERINGILSMITEELPDVPLYYVTDELSKVLRCGSPPAKILRSGLLNAGYRVSGFHGRINSMKTDAPTVVLWDIMRKWAETQNIKRDQLKEDSSAFHILNQPIKTENISLDLHPKADLPSQFKGVVRFPVMPPYWGPKAKAKISREDGSVSVSETLNAKSKKFQGKRKKKLENERIDKKSKVL